MKCFVLCLVLSTALASEDVDYHPLYKYRYQTQDVMKTSASELPVHGYHFVEGNYYPDKYSSGYQQSFERFHPPSFDYFGPSNYYQPSFYPYNNDWHGKIIDHGGLSGGINRYGVGRFVDKNIFSGEDKNLNGESFEKAEGKKGSSGERGTTGFSRGEVALKDEKADSGSYNDEDGFKKGFDDRKSYQGGNHYNKEGGNGQNNKRNNSHKKGHSTKGFKTFHHKDEKGETETYYDEANDEGNNYNYNGNQGSFGEKGESSYKGGHENGQFENDEKRKQGHYNRHRVVDNSNADKDVYDQKGYHGSGEVYRFNNGLGQHSLLGRQEANREFFQNHPYGYIPFNPGY